MLENPPPAYRLYRGIWSALDLFYPSTCGGCGRRGNRWCLNCRAQTERLRPPWCERCGQPVGHPGQRQCRTCLACPPAFAQTRSWGTFAGPLRQAIHRLKYRRDISLGVSLADPLIELFGETGWDCDLVLPVPLGLARLRERGYNQSDLLARPLALALGIPYCSNGLRRIHETRSQVGLTITQRRENVNGAFQAYHKEVSGRSVLVIDDVATSSATLDACAGALFQAGAVRVFGLTLARAGHSAGNFGDGPPAQNHPEI